MRRRFYLTLGLLILLAGTPVLAETVIGHLGGQPGGKNSGSGAITIKGWALADSGIKRVVIQVDGIDIGGANYGKPRPGVESLYPDFPDSEAAGYGYRLNSTLFGNGLHEVSAKAISNDGTVRILSPKIEMQFLNNTSILTPFGAILNPERNVNVYGTCDEANPRRRLTAIEGWVLDLGVETNDAGVGYVELMIDNQLPAGDGYNTRANCTWNASAGGFTSCYGLFTPAIEKLYPFARDAPNAGFRFVVDVGELIRTGYSEGHHTFGIRAGDVSNQVADIDEWGVTFRCIEDVNEGSYGRIESPREGLIYSGTMNVQGWAVDWEQVDRVRILIDGVSIGFADYGEEEGIYETRPGVFSQYWNYPNVFAPVWRLPGGYDTTELADGVVHQMQVRVVDKEGDQTLIGEVTFFVNNSSDN